MDDHLSIITTSDGSKTIFNSYINENYHSKHGAFQESKYVFIKNGLKYFIQLHNANKVSVLEVGFGTGLNFLLSADDCHKKNIKLDYTGIELYPLNYQLISNTDYDKLVLDKIWSNFMHKYLDCFNKSMAITEEIQLTIHSTNITKYQSNQLFDVVYFDAFSKIHQPEMWDAEIIKKCVSFLKPGGVFVTYAITGDLKRTLQSCGLVIEKLPGAPGKREMLRAMKT